MQIFKYHQIELIIMVLELILIYTFVASIAGLAGGLVLILKEEFTKRFSIYFVSFAAGALLATAFLDLLPEGIGLVPDIQFGLLLVLAGVVLFFVIEKLLIWSHCHGNECDIHHESKPYVMMVGDTVHNFIDGIIVAASFLVSIPLGMVTAIAIFFHEIPQEMGDFGTMLHMGLSKKKTILFNLISAAFSFIGAILTYFFAPLVQGLLGLIVMIAAGNLMYIAIADLIPELHHERNTKKAITQIIFMLLEIVIIWGLSIFLAE